MKVKVGDWVMRPDFPEDLSIYDRPLRDYPKTNLGVITEVYPTLGFVRVSGTDWFLMEEWIEAVDPFDKWVMEVRANVRD